eukprot:TRINITY_DN44892_c0_g1_i1.p1 TRINITY_DN44892_c0_g1~~TRINITY_DN44892_c0_g1_i1.p1  ORF type:complete len:350 (+),score=20.72 TRINITY_DN44892_c0_g1_i1:72-1052(+)
MPPCGVKSLISLFESKNFDRIKWSDDIPIEAGDASADRVYSVSADNVYALPGLEPDPESEPEHPELEWLEWLASWRASHCAIIEDFLSLSHLQVLLSLPMAPNVFMKPHVASVHEDSSLEPAPSSAVPNLNVASAHEDSNPESAKFPAAHLVDPTHVAPVHEEVQLQCLDQQADDDSFLPPEEDDPFSIRQESVRLEADYLGHVLFVCHDVRRFTGRASLTDPGDLDHLQGLSQLINCGESRGAQSPIARSTRLRTVPTSFSSLSMWRPVASHLALSIPGKTAFLKRLSPEFTTLCSELPTKSHKAEPLPSSFPSPFTVLYSSMVC